jgi:hypothetical protein
VGRVNAELLHVLQEPAIVERLRAVGTEAKPSTPEQLRRDWPPISQNGRQWSTVRISSAFEARLVEHGANTCGVFARRNPSKGLIFGYL